MTALDANGDFDGNRVPGAVPENVLRTVVMGIVDDAEAVEIDRAEGDNSISFTVHVASGDVGRVIGRHGRTAQAIRQVVHASAFPEGLTVDVDFAD
ncbi:MAG: KH domain-containing protein [Actinobacteria bacterium]|nr:KH domain-containing protein [Actinomycetota bacterium]MCB9388099.1 KH domain-containing protein [Acidimicrobiia bacterium]